MYIMKWFILMFLIICTVVDCAGQKKNPIIPTAYSLNKIDNKSVLIAYNYIETLYLDSTANELCRNASPLIIKRLVENLNNHSQVLVSHVILSKDLENTYHSLKYAYNYSRDTITGTTYTYNNFTWTQLKDGKIIIEDSEIKKIVEFWYNRHTENMIIVKNCN